MKRKKVWAYLDCKKLVEVIQAALNNMTVAEMKSLLIKENPDEKCRVQSLDNRIFKIQKKGS